MSQPTRSCTEVSLVLTVFAGGCLTDLPDDVALHLQSCSSCMSRFDELFPPLKLGPSTQPQPRKRPQPRGSVAILALGFIAVGLSEPQPDVDPVAMMLHGESPLTIDEMLALEPECPMLASETDPPVCPEDDGEWM
jgi:hypothetical protein